MVELAGDAARALGGASFVVDGDALKRCSATPVECKAASRHGGSPKLTGRIGNVSGRLAPDVIERIVRQNFGRPRACYLSGLLDDPDLRGTVKTRFVIARDGTVKAATDAGSNLPDPGVISCVVNGFKALVFPAPESGLVVVDFPITFTLD